jgi:hypothetical protein
VRPHLATYRDGMARRKLSEEERKARHRAGVKRWQRRVDRQVDELFSIFDARNDDSDPEPSEFASAYYHEYGERFPLIYARAHTEFGERYGRKTNFEDCSLGVYTPFEDVVSVEEALKKADELMARYDAYYNSPTPEQRSALDANNAGTAKPQLEDDLESDTPF